MSGDWAITSRNHLTYKDAGVDIDAGNALVKAIKPLAAATARPGTAAGLGGFGALFDLAQAGYRDPLLVATTDGVGTKLRIALDAGRHETVGIDLVAMCVNDLVVQGAEPLFFLDYFATGKLDVETGRTIVGGIAEGCRLAGCALVGGETAEMPDFYQLDDYDLAGFAVGAVERDRLLTGETVGDGDRLIGLASSGLHSNGFSLVRKVVANLGLDWETDSPFAPGRPLGTELLTPTRIYVRSCLAAIAQGGVKALAHITGGGLVENLPRVLPAGCIARLEPGAWPVPPVFGWLARHGGIPATEMLRTFNCGVGMVAVVEAEQAQSIGRRLAEQGETVFAIGTIEYREGAEPQVSVDPEGLAWRA